MNARIVSGLAASLLCGTAIPSARAIDIVGVNLVQFGRQMSPETPAGAPGARTTNWNNVIVTATASDFFPADGSSAFLVNQKGEQVTDLMMRFRPAQEWVGRSLSAIPAIGDDGREKPLTPALSPSDGERVAEGRARGFRFVQLVPAGA